MRSRLLASINYHKQVEACVRDWKTVKFSIRRLLESSCSCIDSFSDDHSPHLVLTLPAESRCTGKTALQNWSTVQVLLSFYRTLYRESCCRPCTALQNWSTCAFQNTNHIEFWCLPIIERRRVVVDQSMHLDNPCKGSDGYDEGRRQILDYEYSFPCTCQHSTLLFVYLRQDKIIFSCQTSMIWRFSSCTCPC
jgi:hypothetical protein